MPALVYPAVDRALRRTAAISSRWASRHRGRGRLFQQFLVAALDAALALAQDLDVAVLVGQHLELDVPRRADELLQVDVGGAKRAAGLVLRLQEQRGQFLRAVDDAHAAAAASGAGLEDHGVADPGRQFAGLLRAAQHAGRSGQHRHPHFAHERARALLDAHQPDHVRPGADELDAGCLADLGEAGVLAEEAIAGMDGVHVGDFRGADDGGNVQVAARALGRPDADGLVGEADVGTVAVRLGIDGDRLDAQLLAGADDPNGDFAPIGDENFLKWYGWQTEPPRTPPADRSSPACFP